MSDPLYRVFVRVPIPRGDFVDPPPVNWDSSKDEALWKILSKVAKTQINWTELAARFGVTVDFLIRQVAYLTEQHASQVRDELRKAAAAAKGSAAPSPVPGSEAVMGYQRTASALLGRRDSPFPRNEASGSATPMEPSFRPNFSRNTSGNSPTYSHNLGGGSTPRPTKEASRKEEGLAQRRRMSSLSTPYPNPPSPGPASSSSDDSDDSSPAQSRIIRRPPRFQQQDESSPYGDDDDDAPAFQALNHGSSDLTATVRGDTKTTSKDTSRGKGRLHRSQTSDSSTGSAAIIPRQPNSGGRALASSGAMSSRAAQPPGRSPSGKSSDGTPSMGSSFSDLDDSSVTQSAMAEALAAGLQDGAIGSRLSLAQSISRRYFINDIDEIRNIENPDYYYKYFLDQSERVNDCQAFAFNLALEDIVHSRLEKEGFEKVLLPLEASPTEPHVPIFASADVATKSRIMVIFGDTSQMLGVLAMRVVNGPGGIDKGSMVSIVREIKKQRCAPDDAGSPGVILANPAALWWWPEGKRALDTPMRNRVPMTSAVHLQRLHDDRTNTIPENHNSDQHTEYMFKHVIPHLTKAGAKIDVIGIGHACEALESFLDKDENWKKYGAGRLNALVFLGGHWRFGDGHNEGFKEFLKTRSRVYIPDESPVNTPIANIGGNPNYPAFTSFGCPVYSAGACGSFTEMILIQAHAAILGWLQMVTDTPGYENNPDMAVLNRVVASAGENDDEARYQAWAAVPDEAKPPVHILGDKEAKIEAKLARALLRQDNTGVFCPSDDEDEDEE
ncbi:uncharacterized protein DNG_02704 [Cephalotrichum gorgonifer]|uniref:Autophagy-related protein 29 n=1 Tax=Cephalotrichum gorgonifer TaxID=2041049 RepID=A0AAE8MV18_9PEZI|nr:uncharacterized protein DNG_02704 [Cephalotrichum gorgonifer]